MKNSTLLLIISVSLLITSFTPPKSKISQGTYYAYVTAYERDKQIEGSVILITNIVTFDCDMGDSGVTYQFGQHYKGEEETDERQLDYNYTSVRAWIYDTEEEALASRRTLLADLSSSKPKRSISNFSVICN